MHRLWIATLMASLAAAAPPPERPRHVFELERRLTPPSSQGPREIGRDFLRTTAPQYGLVAEDLDAAEVVTEYRTGHNGVTHLVYRQQFEGLEVANADWTLNIDASGQVINAGGSLARSPAAGVAAPDTLSAIAAVRAAARSVNGKLAERFAPLATGSTQVRGLRFAGSTFPGEIEAAPVWWEIETELRPAWKFGVTDSDGITRYAVVVDAQTRRVLSRRRLTLSQAPRGLVYDQGSPQPNPHPGVALTAPPPVVERSLQPFAGDPVASPKGWVAGTETAGNNVVAGTNLTGDLCTASLNCLTRPQTAVAPDRNFSFPLDLGTNPTRFPDASSTSVFYWANKAHDWFYLTGFDEAAGNYQQDNFGRGGVAGDPIVAYALFGASYPGQGKVNNSFYVPADDRDGSQAAIAFFLETVDNVYYDNGLDAFTVVHEYTHGVSTRLVRELNAGHQGGSMGEAWSDFFALEFLTPEGAPPDGVYPFSEYPDQVFGTGIRSRPYSTRTDVNPLTYASLGRVYFEPEVHFDGEIWMEALWEVRANLIRQFGEREGRRRARLLVIDGMKLSPPAPSMVDMRDAILLADQVDFKGASQAQLWAAFAKRGLGVLAVSHSGNSVHVRESTEVPSPRGSLAFYEDQYAIGEQLRIVLQDANLTGDSATILVRGGTGDVETVLLQRQGPVYTGFLDTDYAPVVPQDAVLSVIPGDFITAFYNDVNAPGGFFQAQATVPVSPDYALSYRPNTPVRFSGERPLGLLATNVKPYALPFPFPFFGRNYSQVWVHSFGLLSFDSPVFAACADPVGLAVTNGIAPMFMDLATDGGAQAGEDVYVSVAQDSVTFRWAAETLPDFNGSQPQPVNFAATLYRDGRIQYNYGAGNRNLVGGSNLRGCFASSPIVGISNGHETFAEEVPTHDGKGTLENAQTVVLDPPFNASSAPSVSLEAPADGDHVQGVLSGKGIVYDPDPEGGIRRVDILVDGIAVDTATLNVARLDFCNAQRVPGCPNVGFTFFEPLAQMNIKPGNHTLQIRTTNRRGYFVDTPAQPLAFVVEEGEPHQPVGVIESPAAGQQVSGSITVRGYAYADLAKVAEVDVLVDGVTDGEAAFGTARNDICGGLSPAPPDCPRIGFTYTLNTRLHSDGPHTLSLRVYDRTGRIFASPEASIEIRVNNSSAGPPQAVLSTPQTNQQLSGTVKVSGYAWAPSGSVARVLLLVDGYPLATPVYGAPRPEACASLPDVRACPNIGFDVDFDTSRVANGPHFLQVVVDDDKGNRSFAPNPFNGVNVIIRN